MLNGFVDVDGGRLFYQEHGEGDHEIVWVHGLPLNSDCWYGQVQYFKSTYRNIALDLRGYGQSSELPADIESVTELYCSDLLALFKELKLKQPTLVGFASGGHVTLKFATLHSDLIRELVLINASPCFMQQDDWQWGFTKATLDDFIDKITKAESLQQLSDIIFNNTFKEHSDQTQLIRVWFDQMLAKAKKETLIGFFNSIAYDDNRSLLKNISVPTLILSGILSTEVPSNVGLYLREHIQQSQLVELNGIDQFTFATQSSLVNQAIEQFLEPRCNICLPD